MDVIFGEKIIIQNNRNINEVTVEDINKSINIVLPDIDINQLYLLMIYNIKGPYMHYMIANIPGRNIERGEIVYSYMLPKSQRTYVISLYKQQYEVNIAPTNSDIVLERDNFPLNEFLISGNLQLESIAFFNIEPKETGNPGISANPYRIRAKSVGTSSKRCGMYYNYDKFPDDYLRTYISLNKDKMTKKGLHVPDTMNRENMLVLIKMFKNLEQ